MSQKKRIEILKKYPVIWGILLIFIIMCVILAIKLDERHHSAEATVVTADMGREATTEGFSVGSDTVKYLMAAVKEKDLDKAMRAFPLDELVLCADCSKIIEMSEAFSYDTLPPSSLYSQYAPAAASELAGRYAEVYGELSDMFDWDTVEIAGVDLLLADRQKDDDFKIAASEYCDAVGSDALCELAVRIRADEGDYFLPVTVVRYESSWKVLGIESLLLENYDGGAVQTDDSAYESMTSKDTDEIWESLNSSENAAAEWEFAEKPEEQMLPPNYFVAGQAYADKPEEAIREFTIYLQKEDLTTALCYGDLKHENIETDISQALYAQKDFAGQITRVYYSMLFNKMEGDRQSLKSLGMTGTQIVDALSPVYIPYMDLIKTVSLGGNEYAAVYYYGREHYLIGFTMSETEEGWQISSLKSPKAGLPDGGVKKISEEEYNKLGEED